MPRPRTFDETRALDAAMRAFWATGYAGTSTEDLCAATGLGRSSVYNTFVGKRELFLAALRRYMDLTFQQLVDVLDEPAPIRDRLREVFRLTVEPPAGDPVGCLVVNTVVEFGTVDPEVDAMLHGEYERRVALLRDAIAAARSGGEIGSDRDPETLARFVGSTVTGMRVVARGGADRAALAAVAETALAAF